MKDGRYESFEEFWPFYLQEHAHPVNRRMHVIGTSCAVGIGLFGLASRRLWLIPIGIGIGYGAAWVGHFFVQKNRPATFKYPLWSLRGDFVMLGKTLAGTLPK